MRMVAVCEMYGSLTGDVSRCSVVLLRLAYLGVANGFALLRLLPMSDRDKGAEILALRHQFAILQRQLGAKHVPLEKTIPV